MTTTAEINSLDLAGCPKCGAPAQVVDRFVLESTNGPVEHVRMHCVRRHWFLMLTRSLAEPRSS